MSDRVNALMSPDITGEAPQFRGRLGESKGDSSRAGSYEPVRIIAVYLGNVSTSSRSPSSASRRTDAPSPIRVCRTQARAAGARPRATSPVHPSRFHAAAQAALEIFVAAYFAVRRSSFLLAQDCDDLLLAEPAPPHLPSPYHDGRYLITRAFSECRPRDVEPTLFMGSRSH
jgi:hypothetical protein